jgi:hypothetical protein
VKQVRHSPRSMTVSRRFSIAIIVTLTERGGRSVSERLLSWILLLPISLTGLRAGVFHLYFPVMAASFIGWQVSPFQSEVGMADLAIGTTARVSFGRDLSLKDAAVRAAKRTCTKLSFGCGTWAVPAAPAPFSGTRNYLYRSGCVISRSILLTVIHAL